MCPDLKYASSLTKMTLTSQTTSRSLGPESAVSQTMFTNPPSPRQCVMSDCVIMFFLCYYKQFAIYECNDFLLLQSISKTAFIFSINLVQGLGVIQVWRLYECSCSSQPSILAE